MQSRGRRRRPAPVTGAFMVALLVAGCSPPASDGGEIVLTADERIPEVRAAREVLAEPVPAVTGEAARLAEALEDVWTLEAAADERAARATALRLDPFRDALDAIVDVDVEGVGPDVAAVRELLAAIEDDGAALLAATEAELATIETAAAFDAELLELLARWDERGSYSQQLNAFEELAVDVLAMADDAEGRTATPECTGVWERRASGARTAAERTEELRGLVRDRRGQEFDDLRDAYRQDPFGLGALLGVLDAEAAAACWAEASEAAAARARIEGHVEDLAAALDPADLRG